MNKKQSPTAYFPILNTLHNYEFSFLRCDFTAGITVAILAIPQVMVFAMIAGVPPIQGLYAAMLPAIVGSALRSSDHIITGPSNATALMLATVLGLLGDFPDTEALLKIVFLVTFLVGIIQIGCGLLKLGDLFHFVSYSVTVGLTTGAGLLIAGNQLDKFCGLDIQKAPHLYLQVWRVLTKLHTLNLPTFFVGIITLAGLVLLKRFAPKFPAELIILIGISLLVFAFNLETQGVQLIGTIPYALLPVSFVHTDIRTVPLLLSGASSIAILGMVEALSIGKMIALSSGQQIDINQEFIGQGTANVIGSFFSCMTSSGSFTRSALNFKSGAKTRVSGILSGVFVFSIVFLFARYARYIPIPALAAIVMHVAYDMINPEQIRIAFRSTRSDVIVLLSTFFAIILFDLQVALYAGIAFHVIFFLRQSSQPNITRLLSHPDGSFREVPITSSEKQRPVEIIQFEGALFFGAERAVERIINTFLNNVTTPHVVVFRMKRTHHFDANFIVMFSKIIKRFRSRNIPLLFCGVHSELQLLFDLSGLTQLIGEDFIFTAQENLFESTTEAIQYAYILLDKGMER